MRLIILELMALTYGNALSEIWNTFKKDKFRI